MSAETLDLKVSIEAEAHKQFKAVALALWHQHGLRVDRISFDWHMYQTMTSTTGSIDSVNLDSTTYDR